jgi:hypothetical protein
MVAPPWRGYTPSVVLLCTFAFLSTPFLPPGCEAQRLSSVRERC